MNSNAKWIKCGSEIGETSPNFKKRFGIDKKVVSAQAYVSAIGVYDLFINGEKVGKGYMEPGWTSMENRVQYQTYDITDMLTAKDNEISIIAGKGWGCGEIGYIRLPHNDCSAISVIASVELTYEDGTKESILTDDTWEVYTSEIAFSEIYDGETVDKSATIKKLGNAYIDSTAKPKLIDQVGEFITERERVLPSELIITPKGERVIDFGQNMVGYVELSIKASKGDRIVMSHAEVLDKHGNFYTDNLRGAKNLVTYICSGEDDLFKLRFSFRGFRYIRLDEYPFDEVDLDGFTAVAVYSDIKRTGRFVCGNDKLNRLYSNIIWGQRSNFLDIPTDCPQRDERMGWTGDAEVFCRTAAINYDVEKFFHKWMGDMALEQGENGLIWGVVPLIRDCGERISAAWGDAAVICPWEIYKAYGNLELLRENYPMMKKWVEYMHNFGEEEFLWAGAYHYGDWLGMDAGYGIYMGATQTDLIATAFFAYSTGLVVKAGKVLGEDTSYFEELYANVRKAFRETFMKDGVPTIYPKYDALSTDRPVKADTQTAISLILRFGLFEENEREGLVGRLVELINEYDGCMTTGFVGTPHILHALSDNGRADVAYDLLLQEKNPSWLFSVNHGATTIWEHWDSINDEGDMWDVEMNSFNHYAYGSVFDWMFGDMLGIKICDDGAAYTKIEIEPLTDKRIGFAEGAIDSRSGEIAVSWRYIGEKVRYDITIPENTEATLKIKGMSPKVIKGGSYTIVK